MRSPRGGPVRCWDSLSGTMRSAGFLADQLRFASVWQHGWYHEPFVAPGERREYTRTRMVQLAPYLVADSVESYRTDYIDGENIEAVFDPAELDEGLAFRQSIPADLMSLLREWTQGFCPLNTIERSLSDLIDARESNPGAAQRRGVDAKTRWRCSSQETPDRLHGQPIGASRPPRARGGDVREREHAQHPARVRARDHVPVRPVVRLQRVLQVLQERSRTHSTSSFRPSTARTTTAASPT